MGWNHVHNGNFCLAVTGMCWYGMKHETQPSVCTNETTNEQEWVSGFLKAHQHILGHSVPYDGVEDITKEWRYNKIYQRRRVYFTTNTDLFSFLRSNAHNLRLLLVKNDLMNAGKHLLEVFLQTRNVLAVANDLQQILIANEVESTSVYHRKLISAQSCPIVQYQQEKCNFSYDTIRLANR